MNTIYDWVTVAIFAALIVLFLHRSVAEEQTDRVIDYAPPALCCAVANYFGNEGNHIVAILLIAIIPVYTWYVLKPFAR